MCSCDEEELAFSSLFLKFPTGLKEKLVVSAISDWTAKDELLRTEPSSKC